MWSPVQATSSSSCHSQGSPVARCKHAMCVSQDGHIYLFGGRSANRPLKDLWRFDPGQNQWEEVKCRGHHPPNLQEHTMVAWNNKLYIFGGEIGFSSNGETPLWILDLATCTWKKQTAEYLPPSSSETQPSGRRGHTAVLYGDAMHVFGGFQDIRGSSSELWTFDFLNEQWHLMSGGGSSSSKMPPPRHAHSAVIHEASMWIYGGMTDLQSRSDLWKWDFSNRKWYKIKAKTNKSPGQLHGHTAIKAFDCMFIFGGEHNGNLLHELWKFSFANEGWERINIEGIVPKSRFRHTAVANPFLFSTDQDETITKTCLTSSKSASNSESNSLNKAVNILPPKSASMCFGQSTDAHRLNGKPIKPFKFRVHPSGLCSGKSATLSDEEEDEVNGIANDNYGKDFANQVTMRKKSLKDKISKSRLVRSISSSSYNILNQQAEALKDELERLVEESTPQMVRTKDIVIANPSTSPGIGPNKPNNNYRRLKSRAKIQKSMSSHAVLESDSEPSTPQHRSTRPLSEVIQTQSIAATPFEEDEIIPWSKRHTIHESMSYYSLCFPTPQQSKSGSESSVNDTDSLTRNLYNDEGILSVELNSETKITENNHRFSSSIDKENINSALIDLDETNPNSIVSPVDARPKSSGYNSLVTLYTPSVEQKHEISHSVSHSSGYHSFTDESLYDHKEFVGVFQQQVQTNSMPFSRRSVRNSKDSPLDSPMELKAYLSTKNSFDSSTNHSQIAENGVPLAPLRMSKELRTRSWDRSSLRRDVNLRGNILPVNEHVKPTLWQPQINAIKEVVVPGSPANRKWSYSPSKARLHQHHWQLCMYIFGGKEDGVSGIYKEAMSIWKLYV